MTCHLPYIPRLAGFLGPILSPEYFITSHLSLNYPSQAERRMLTDFISKDATAQLLAYQLANAYLLLGLLGLFIFSTTSELRVVNAYLWALWLGDIGHVAANLYALGWRACLDPMHWTAVVWGNVGFTAFLFLTRSTYFLGWFGSGSHGSSGLHYSRAHVAVKNE